MSKKSLLPPPSFFKPDLPDETIYHVGVSGGKDSTAVLLYMVHESGVPHHKIDVTFADTGNEHQHTYDQIKLLSETVFPIQTLLPPLGFYELARKKKRFPSTKARFCTEHLKIRPSVQHLTGLQAACKTIVAVSGVRADESTDRAFLEEWDYSNALLALQWRPLIKWKIADVLAIHRKYNVPLNPLYALGARRVGCFPCIMSNKAEMRNIALNFPDRIDMIRSQEDAFLVENGRYSSFFPRNAVPPRFRTMGPYIAKDGTPVMVASVDDVVRWSMTGKRAKGSYLDDPKEPISCVSGFCE